MRASHVLFVGWCIRLACIRDRWHVTVREAHSGNAPPLIASLTATAPLFVVGYLVCMPSIVVVVFSKFFVEIL